MDADLNLPARKQTSGPALPLKASDYRGLVA